MKEEDEEGKDPSFPPWGGMMAEAIKKVLKNRV
jgi:hypothetical protein